MERRLGTRLSRGSEKAPFDRLSPASQTFDELWSALLADNLPSLFSDRSHYSGPFPTRLNDERRPEGRLHFPRKLLILLKMSGATRRDRTGDLLITNPVGGFLRDDAGSQNL